MKRKLLLLVLIGGTAMFLPSCKKKGCTNPAASNYDSKAKKDDASCMLTWYQDADGDGKGNPDVTTNALTAPEGYVATSDDNNDLAVSQRQNAVVIYEGATWCPPCGSYGEPAKKDMETKYGDKVALMSIQSTDEISGQNDFGPKFVRVYKQATGSTSIPHLFWSSHNFTFAHTGLSNDIAYNKTWTSGIIDQMLSKTAECGVNASAKVSGNTVTVTTKTKFYTAATQRWIGVYLLEDGIMASQDLDSGGPVDSAHDNVLRKAADNATGDLGTISLGTAFTSGQTVEGTYTITKNASWKAENLDVVVVIWEGNEYNKISNGVKAKVK